MFLKIRQIMNSGTILGYFLQAVPITIVVGIIYLIFRLRAIKRKKSRIAWVPESMRLLFVCYLTGLCSLVILPANFWLHFFDGVFYGWWEYMGAFFKFGEVNLIPTLVKYLSGEVSLGPWVKEMIVGNIIMFMPLGLLLPFVTKKLNGKNAVILSVVVPLIVESLQLFFGRSFDIDDLICNFLGIVIGFLVAGGIKKLAGTASKSKNRPSSD